MLSTAAAARSAASARAAASARTAAARTIAASRARTASTIAASTRAASTRAASKASKALKSGKSGKSFKPTSSVSIPIKEVKVSRRQNPNVKIVGTPIRQTWDDWIFRTQRYMHDLTYEIGNGEKNSCEIITTTPVLEGTISYEEDINTKFNYGGLGSGNICSSINSCIKLNGKNGETIHNFGNAPYEKDTFACSLNELKKYKPPSELCEFKLSKAGGDETFNALIPMGVTCVEFF